MCITSKDARLTDTKILSYKLDNGKHLLSYKNKVVNIAGKPNCMLLAVPGKITKEDFIDTTSFGNFFEDFENSKPRMRSLGKGFPKLGEPVQHLTLGLYEILVADEASKIKENLQLVSEEKMPEISDELISWFDKHYSGWNIVLCCFNQNIDSQPIMFTFTPRDPDVLFFPGVDSHGGIPNLNKSVDVDHSLFFNGEVFSIAYSQTIPDFMPKKMNTMTFMDGELPNGDWYYQISSGKLVRVKPVAV